MAKLLQTLAKPITVPIAASVRSVAAMNEPLKRHIIACEANGEDVTAAVWKEYSTYQYRLLPYRWQKFTEEFNYLARGEVAVSNLGRSEILLLTRWATKCLFLFILFTIIGRRSLYPPLEPTSGFVEEVVRQWQPNHAEAMPSPVVEDRELLFADIERKESERKAHRAVSEATHH